MNNVTQNTEVIKTDEIKIQIETITPEIAREYLKLNIENNRNLKNSKNKSYARDMAAGAWPLTPECIEFNKDGNLFNGQNRLNAVILAGVPVRFMVARNCANEVMQVVDKGFTRSYLDSVKISGEADPLRCNMNMPRLVRGILELELSIKAPSDSEITYFCDQFRDTISTVLRVEPNNTWPISAPVHVAYFAALRNGVPEDALYAYSQCLKCGKVIGNYNTTAVLAWKNAMVNAKVKHARLSRRAVYVGTQNSIWYFMKASGYRAELTKQRYPIKEEVIAAVNGRLNHE